MPLLRLEVTVPVAAPQKETLLRRASKVIAELLGKPESYVMVTLVECAAVLGGEAGPTAFADIRAIGGLTEKTNDKLVKALSTVLHEELGIVEGRIFMNFTDVPGSHWGARGGTVG